MLWRHCLVSGFLGSGEYLSRTENLIHTLGSVTSLCCTDKKGILSWPNTSAEKVFLLKKKKQSGGGDQSAAPAAATAAVDQLSEINESGDLEDLDRKRLLSTNTNETGSPPHTGGTSSGCLGELNLLLAGR